MLRTTSPQPSLWEAILPQPCQGLPAELARVDALLDDPAFWEPFRAHFDPVLGRPSISWQRFCRIPRAARCLIRPPWSS